MRYFSRFKFLRKMIAIIAILLAMQNVFLGWFYIASAALYQANRDTLAKFDQEIQAPETRENIQQEIALLGRAAFWFSMFSLIYLVLGPLMLSAGIALYRSIAHKWIWLMISVQCMTEICRSLYFSQWNFTLTTWLVLAVYWLIPWPWEKQRTGLQ